MIRWLDTLDCIDKLRYFGDLIGASGGAEKVSISNRAGFDTNLPMVTIF